MAGVDLVTVKDLLGHTGINMTVRYSHLVPEHKAQAVAKLEERFKVSVEEVRAQSAVVSPELKEAIGAVLTPKLEENRNVFWCEEVAGWELLTKSKIMWRRRADSNRCIEVLQTSPLTTWVRRLTKIGNMNFPTVATTAEIVDNPRLKK
jgi:hypothetical protein